MSPDELLGHGVLGDGAELVEEGAALEVEVEAIAEAQFVLAHERVGLRAEGEPHVASAFLVAGEHLLPDGLRETEGEVAVLDLLLFGNEVVEDNLLLKFFHDFFIFSGN